VTIQIVDNAFVDPTGRRNANASVTITLGQTVGWRNDGGDLHTVTSTTEPNGANPFDSGDINPGGTFTVTPNVTGTYIFRCENHPDEMFDATIIVQ
jgi:plastocyanin